MASTIPNTKEEEIRRLKKAFWAFASSLGSKEGENRGPSQADVETASRLALRGNGHQARSSGIKDDRSK